MAAAAGYHARGTEAERSLSLTIFDPASDIRLVRRGYLFLARASSLARFTHTLSFPLCLFRFRLVRVWMGIFLFLRFFFVACLSGRRILPYRVSSLTTSTAHTLARVSFLFFFFFLSPRYPRLRRFFAYGFAIFLYAFFTKIFCFFLGFSWRVSFTEWM